MPKKRVYKIAHFSDLHISDDDEVTEALSGIEHALDNGANHVVISGDITACADITLTREFLKGMARMGLNSPKKLSLVPGNHDVYPIGDWRMNLTWPSDAYNAFCRSVAPLVKERLFSNVVFPFGKVLAPGIVLAGLDTTISGTSDPRCWAEGELPDEHLDEVAAFFGRHQKAAHRIVLMHHFPFYARPTPIDCTPWEANMNFTQPEASIVRNWLAWATATLVLCGHVHRDVDRQTEDGVRVLCTGNGYQESGYFLISLHGSGKVTYRGVVL